LELCLAAERRELFPLIILLLQAAVLAMEHAVAAAVLVDCAARSPQQVAVEL
jgi:hypothetical protein